MAARKTAAAKIAEYQQLREAAHQKIDRLTRPQLKKFVSSNGPLKTKFSEGKEQICSQSNN